MTDRSAQGNSASKAPTRGHQSLTSITPLVFHWSVLVAAVLIVNPLGLGMPTALRTLVVTAGLPIHGLAPSWILASVVAAAVVPFGCARAVAVNRRTLWTIRLLLAALVLLSMLHAVVAASSDGPRAFAGLLPSGIGAVAGYTVGAALTRARTTTSSPAASHPDESTQPRGSAVPRRLFGAQVTMTVICVLVATAGLPILVFPSNDALERSDVAVVLGPATPERVALADGLVEDGMVSGVVISTVGDEAARPSACRSPRGTVCIHAAPFTTRGEADAVGLLADEKGWTSLVVITGTPHISRARLVFDSCTRQRILMLAAETADSAAAWVYAYLYQGGAFLKMLAAPPCSAGDDPPATLRAAVATPQALRVLRHLPAPAELPLRLSRPLAPTSKVTP